MSDVESASVANISVLLLSLLLNANDINCNNFLPIAYICVCVYIVRHTVVVVCVCMSLHFFAPFISVPGLQVDAKFCRLSHRSLSPFLYPNHSPAPISRHISLSAAWVASGEHQGMPHKPSETAYLPTHLPNYPSSAAKQTSAPCRPWGERRSLDLKGRASTWWWRVNCPGERWRHGTRLEKLPNGRCL